MAPALPDYRNLFDQSSLIRIVVAEDESSDFIVLDANKAATRYFGSAHEDMRDRRLDCFLDPDNTAHVTQALTICRNSGVTVTLQIIPKRPADIRLISFMLEPLKDADGKVKWITMQAQPPAADSAAIERERNDALSMFATVFDISEVGITVSDHNGRFVKVNSAFMRQTGWDELDLSGFEITKIVPLDLHDAAWEHHAQSYKKKRHVIGESTILKKDGTTMPVMAGSVVIDLSNGRSFCITTLVDITELKAIETDLRKAKEAADEANKAKSSFLANMSHELRTPLNAIIGFSEMMLNGTMGRIDNDHYLEYLGDIQFSARHLLQIINDVLDMSKIEAGKMPLDDEEIELAAMAHSVCRLLQSRAQEQEVQLSCSADSDTFYITADERLVRQVFLNILSNAIKFSHPGGTVSIDIVQDRGYAVTFTDTGIGIAQDRIEDIMEPFGQVDVPRINKGQGTGLGLPIAKAMMEMHGGSLAIESELGRGTKVTCRFPAGRVITKA